MHRLHVLLIALALALTPSVGFSQAYPNKPVKVIVTFPPGGTPDIYGRVLSQELSNLWKQAVVVENKAGASGTIGTDFVAKALPDGYTLLFAADASITIAPLLYSKNPYDPVRDFEPVSLMALGPNVLVVHPSLPAHSVAELIALANAQPGRIGFAGAGNASTPHLAGELFNTMAGVQMIHIPYRGSGPAMIGLLAGDVPVMFLPAINAFQHISSGRLRVLAVTSRERLAALPDVPTLSSAGLAGYESSQWYGLLAPAGTKAEILALLNSHVAKIMQGDEMKLRMKNDGLVPIGGSREQFATHIRTEIDKWAKVIRASGATVD